MLGGGDGDGDFDEDPCCEPCWDPCCFVSVYLNCALSEVISSLPFVLHCIGASTFAFPDFLKLTYLHHSYSAHFASHMDKVCVLSKTRDGKAQTLFSFVSSYEVHVVEDDAVWNNAIPKIKIELKTLQLLLKKW